MFFDTWVYFSNMYPGLTYIPGATLFAMHQIFFLHWSLGQQEKMGRQGEKRRWAGGERQGANADGEEGFLLISPSASGKAYARDSSALFLHARGRPLATHCASSPRTVEEVGYGILLHS
jgi:hypothetical protein